MDTLGRPIPSISPDRLAELLLADHAPTILDVRPQHRFAQSGEQIATAVRCAPENLDTFAASRSPARVITYCVFGHEVSQRAAATLRSHGWDAAYLSGGISGGEDGIDAPDDIQRWRSGKLPIVQKVQGQEGGAT